MSNSLLGQYLASIPSAMERGRVRAALERRQGFSGEVMPRHVWAETHAATVDIDRGRLWTGDNTFYEFGDVTLALVRYVVFLQSAPKSVHVGPIARHVMGAINGAMGLNPACRDDFLSDWERHAGEEISQ